MAIARNNCSTRARTAPAQTGEDAEAAAKDLSTKGGVTMDQGRSGMGSHKHGTSGRSPKSPPLVHAMKREAESQVRIDRTRIIDPQTSIEELFHGKERARDDQFDISNLPAKAVVNRCPRTRRTPIWPARVVRHIL